MYFPFLKGKQNELFAVSELASLIQETQKVIPIFEPINLNSTIRRLLPEINSSGVPFILIVNPQTGDLSNSGYEVYRSLLDAIDNKQLVTLGYFITHTTSMEEILQVMSHYSEFQFAFIHTTNSSIRDSLAIMIDKINYHIFIDGKVSTSYLNAYRNKNRVIIKDPFIRLSRNADYKQDEYFSDLFSTYATDYYGFGDYQTVGSGTSGGGPAHAVALHLTYLKEPNGLEIWVRHFVSDDTVGTSNVQGKYFQALRKLVAFLDQYNNTQETRGAQEYRDNLVDGVFHQLGFPKKLSIKHHIELMIQLLRESSRL